MLQMDLDQTHEVLFVRLRVISWIESLPTAGDPLNHTKDHQQQNLFSFMKLTSLLAGSTVIVETLNQVWSAVAGPLP